MPNGKRQFDVIEISDDGSEVETAERTRRYRRSRGPSSKAPRRRGTYKSPIRLDNTDDEDAESHMRGRIRAVKQNPLPPPPPMPEVGQQQRRRSTTGSRSQTPMALYAPADFAGYWDDDEIIFHPDGNVPTYPAVDQLGRNDGVILLDQLEENPHDSRQDERPYPARVPSPEPERPAIVDESECLACVVELFPEIAHDYVAQLHVECSGFLQQVLDKIVEEPNYPKQRDRWAKTASRRESTAEVDEKTYAQENREAPRGKLREALLQVLKDEFPKIPVTYIKEIQTEKRHLFPTYKTLSAAQLKSPCPYTIAVPRVHRQVDFAVITGRYGLVAAQLETELGAARKARKSLEDRYHREEALKKAEERNALRAKATGDVAECASCFDETPTNRMIACNWQEIHHMCYECAGNFLSAQVGDSKCKLDCPSGCGGTFTETQLRRLPNSKLVEKILKMQQEQDVRDAGIDDVVECPFCDFKQVCPPLEVDYEFRCRNGECSITSCRKCQRHTHIPDTCEEAARKYSKDAALEQRHKIEEAMTQALVRNCNKCKKPFIKELGCNKMSCSSCGNLQCYVCSESVTNYNHFHKQGGCPLHDNVEERHEQEVKRAEAEAREKVEADNPFLDKEDLQFRVSERVKKDEEAAEARRRQLAAAGGAAGVAHYAALYGGGPIPDPVLRAQREAAVAQQQHAAQRLILQQANQQDDVRHQARRAGRLALDNMERERLQNRLDDIRAFRRGLPQMDGADDNVADPVGYRLPRVHRGEFREQVLQQDPAFHLPLGHAVDYDEPDGPRARNDLAAHVLDNRADDQPARARDVMARRVEVHARLRAQRFQAARDIANANGEPHNARGRGNQAAREDIQAGAGAGLAAHAGHGDMPEDVVRREIDRLARRQNENLAAQQDMDAAAAAADHQANYVDRLARMEEERARMQEQQAGLEAELARLQERRARLQERRARLQERRARLQERQARLREEQADVDNLTARPDMHARAAAENPQANHGAGGQHIRRTHIDLLDEQRERQVPREDWQNRAAQRGMPVDLPDIPPRLALRANANNIDFLRDPRLGELALFNRPQDRLPARAAPLLGERRPNFMAHHFAHVNRRHGRNAPLAQPHNNLALDDLNDAEIERYFHHTVAHGRPPVDAIATARRGGDDANAGAADPLGAAVRAMENDFVNGRVENPQFRHPRDPRDFLNPADFLEEEGDGDGDDE